MDEQELKTRLERIEEQQSKLLAYLEKSNSHVKRDLWEKLTAISPIISGICIALSALLCTYQYNQQQIKLQEAQTIEKFIPHLMGTDTSKRMAILALKTLVNTDLAAKYAAMFPSEGTLSALRTIAKTGDSRDKKIVNEALDKTIKEVSADKFDRESFASDGIVDGGTNDEASTTEAPKSGVGDVNETADDTKGGASAADRPRAPKGQDGNQSKDDKQSVEGTQGGQSESKQVSERIKPGVAREESAFDL